MKRAYLLFFPLLLLPYLVGCQREVAARPAATPQEAISGLVGGMESGDYDRLAAYVLIEDAQQEVIEKVLRAGVAMYAFRKKFIAAYGEQAWADFQNPEKASDEGDFHFSFAFDDLTIEESPDGDTATAVSVNDPEKELRFVKQEGRWLFETASLFPEGADLTPIGEMAEKMGGVVEKYTKAIGHEGVNPEDIDVEIGKAMARELFGFFDPNGQPRFDIESL